MTIKTWHYFVLMVVIAVFTYYFISTEKEVPLTFITISDVHSTMLPYQTKIDDNKVTVGGIERIKHLVDSIDAVNEGAIFVGQGDLVIGTNYAMFQGEMEFRAFTLAGLDVYCPGNHDFDHGIEIYQHALNYAPFDNVCANLSFNDDELKAKVPPYIIKKINGVDVGFFGLMTPELFRVTKPPANSTLNEDIYAVARAMVDTLHAKKCDIIVALSHCGSNFERELAKDVEGIDIIFGGHSHEKIFEQIGDVIYVMTGSNAQYLGLLKVTYKNKTLLEPSWNLRLVDGTIPSDSGMIKLVSSYTSKMDSLMGGTIGESKTDWDASNATVRKMESNLGNLVADALLNYFDEADIALVNGGGIRGDKIYPAGEITIKTCNDILPFRNEVIMREVTGDQLKQILEISASSIMVEDDGCPADNRAAEGGFLQVGNLRYTINLNNSPYCAVYDGRKLGELQFKGDRITKVEILKDGQWVPVNPEEKYKTVMGNWMSSGGDGYWVMLDEKIPTFYLGVIDTDVFIEYIKTHSPIEARNEGRITLIGL